MECLSSLYLGNGVKRQCLLTLQAAEEGPDGRMLAADQGIETVVECLQRICRSGGGLLRTSLAATRCAKVR